MLKTSKRVRRLEKEAILRAKGYEHTREQSDNLLSKLSLHSDDDDNERHRRHITTRPIRQIQREVDYPVETLEQITERIQQEIKKRQAAAATTTTTSNSNSTARNYHTSLSSSSSADDRTKRDTGNTGKYTTTKHTSGSKLH